MKKIYNIGFIVLFLCMITVPLIFTDWSSGGVSEDENRNLAKFPSLVVDNKYNSKFTSEYETWFMDHLGLRSELISFNAWLHFNAFERLPDNSDYLIGRDGDINYATPDMVYDYAHLNLRSDELVARIGDSYQYISDYLDKKGTQFYFVQCWDKHSIYPEQFVASVNQIGDISKNDQIATYIKDKTTVKTLPMKELLIKNKAEYEVYSNWGDPTHWSERGAFIGYTGIMQMLNSHNDNKFKILKESDYNITIEDKGITLNNVIHREDMLEVFSIKNPKAVKTDTSVMGEFAKDERHSVWKNESADNDTKVLLICDSYIDHYIVEDFAESFSEMWLIWADYVADLDEIVEMYEPDIVIYECAERIERSQFITELADKLKAEEK